MATNESYQKLFELCANEDRISLADYIISSGCSPSAYDARDGAGKTALHVACRHGHFFIVRSLIEIFGCYPAIRDYGGNLPIHDACLYGQLKIVDYLIHFKGTSIVDAVLFTDSEENTLLHKACQSGSVRLVRYLQEILCFNSKECVHRKLNLYNDSLGAYFNISPQRVLSHTRQMLVYCLLAKNRYGDTPLNVACRHGHQSVLKIFKMFIPLMANCTLEVSAIECAQIDVATFILSLNQLPFAEVDSEHPKCPPSIQKFKCLEVPLFESMPFRRKTVECLTCMSLFSTDELSDYDSSTGIGSCPKCAAVRSTVAVHSVCPECHHSYRQYSHMVNCSKCQNRLKLNRAYNNSYPEMFRLDSKSGYSLDLSCKSACHIALRSGNLKAFIQIQAAMKSISSELPVTLLHAACVSDNKTIVAHILKTLNCSPNVCDSEGNTPLHVVCLWGSMNVFLYLSELEDIQKDALNKNNDSPLSLACKYDWNDLCKQLLDNFDSTSIPYPDDETPLHLACSNNNLELVKMIVETNKVSLQFIETADKYGDTPIFNACRNGNLDMVQYLLKWNSNPFHINSITEQSPLHIACRIGRSDIVRALLIAGRSRGEIVDFSVQSSRVQKVLTELAIENNSPEVVSVLLDHCQFNFNQELNQRGGTLVHYVTMFGHLKLAKSLISLESVDWNAQDIDCNTALHIACMQDNVEFVKLIIEHCDTSVVTIQNGNLQTPMHIASQNGEVEILDLLLTKFSGTLDDYQDINGDTLLHVACAARVSSDMVTELCKYSSLTAKNKTQQIPLHIACNVRNTPVVKLLIELFPQNCDLDQFVDEGGNSVLHAAVDSGCLKTVTTVLDRVSPVCTNKLGETPIHIACRKGNFEITRVLLAKEAKIVYSSNGDSYLHSACSGKSLEVIKLLVEKSGLEYGSLLSANNQGNTPLHCVCSGLSTLEVLKFLLDSKRLHYVSLSTANKQGNTLLHCACLSGTYKIISLLISFCSSPSDILKLNKDGLTPFCCLLAQGHVTAAKELLLTMRTAICTNEEPLGHCIIKYSEKFSVVFYLFKFILKRKLDLLLVQCDVDGNTILHSFLYHISRWSFNAYSTESFGVPVIVMLEEIWEDLLKIAGVQINKPNNEGDTPLHVLVQKDKYPIYSERTDMLEMLLSRGVSDSINARNKQGKTPIQLAKMEHMRALIDKGADPSHVETYFKSILDQYKQGHPLDPFSMIIAIGNSTAGKTTLINTLQSTDLPNGQHSETSEGPTAGIQTSGYTSEEFGHVKFHDFGGHPEFESGNAIFLRNLPYPPIFLLLVDIRYHSKLERTVQYWCNYIKDNVPAQLEVLPQVIIVGSHSDCVPSTEHEKIRKCITSAVNKDNKFHVTDIILLDCRKIDSENIRLLNGMLVKCCSSLKRAVDIDCRCHVLFAHLSSWCKWTSSAMKFSELQEKIVHESKYRSDILLPSTTNELLPLLKTLHSGGHIDLLCQDSIDHCWIVLENSLLFKKVNGILFVPGEFSLPKLPANPVVSENKLESLFGETDINLITSYITHSEFCQKITDPEILHLIKSACQLSELEEVKQSANYSLPNDPVATNTTQGSMVVTAQSTTNHPSVMGNYYFFPSLVKCKRPHAVWKTSHVKPSYCFGWYLLCQKNHFFNSRFLQVLLLRLTFNFATLAKYSGSPADPLQHKCDIWKNGIHWSTRTGVEALVEVVQQNTAVILVIRFTKGFELEGVKHRSQVIKKILDTKEEFCPNTEVAEYILSDCSTYPPSNSSFIFIAEVAKAICKGAHTYFVYNSFQESVLLKTVLYYDSYLNHELFKSLWPEEFEPGEEVEFTAKISRALNQSNEDEIWRKEMLVLLESLKVQPNTPSRKEFRKKFSMYSILCGRDPQVSF